MKTQNAQQMWAYWSSEVFFSVFYLILVLQLQGKLKSYLLVGNGLRWNAVGEQKRVLTLWGLHELSAKPFPQSVGFLSFSSIDCFVFFVFFGFWMDESWNISFLKHYLSVQAMLLVSERAQKSHCVLQTAACQLQASRWFVHVRILNTNKSAFREMSGKRPKCRRKSWRAHADAQGLMVVGCSQTIHQWSGNVQAGDLS